MADARKLSKNELIQYMSLVCQMEQNKYLQEKAIEQVESQISRFSNPYNPSKPVEPGKQHKTGGGVFFTILGLFLAYVGITYFVGGAAFYGIFFGGGGLISLMKVYDLSQENSRIEEKNRKAKKDYDEALAQYNKTMSQNNAQKKFAGYLKKELSKMKSQLSVMDEDLNRVYSCNVIYHSYRYLVAVSSFYDYLSSDRCQTLEGHEGAYNLYNMESRLDKIITRLDVISSQLESIKYNQNMLYNVMKDSNQKIDRLQGTVESTNTELATLSNQNSITNAQLQKLTYNSELIRFNTDQTRRELELRNQMEGILSYGWMN